MKNLLFPSRSYQKVVNERLALIYQHGQRLLTNWVRLGAETISYRLVSIVCDEITQLIVLFFRTVKKSLAKILLIFVRRCKLCESVNFPFTSRP